MCQLIIDSWLPVQNPLGSRTGCRCTIHDQKADTYFNDKTQYIRSQQQIPKDPLPSDAMIGWHVARHGAAGNGEGARGGARSVIKMASTFTRAINFPLFRNWNLS